MSGLEVVHCDDGRDSESWSTDLSVWPINLDDIVGTGSSVELDLHLFACVVIRHDVEISLIAVVVRRLDTGRVLGQISDGWEGGD